jgi:ABC-2 type transport system ATP-binding protein
MRQRLKLAQALVHDPEWLFLDEPTSGLDPSGRVSMLELVRDLAAGKGFGVILSTHLLADVRTVCEEILVLRRGELLDHGRVEVSVDDEDRSYRVEGFGDAEAFTAALTAAGVACEPVERGWTLTVPPGGVRSVLESAAATGFALRRLEKHVETLEDLFFRLVDDDDAHAGED